jgi:(E)-4-hydroxy-3-methylbut-2-enyl-diphosphate synthase
VNGPGEARHADLGAAGRQRGLGHLQKKAIVLKTVDDSQIYDALVEEINKL